MLRTQRTNVIGVVIPHPIRNVFSADDPHYFSTVLQAITVSAHKRDYATTLWVGYSGEEADRFYQRIYHNRLMDGLVVVASVETEYALIKNLLDSSTPFVMIGRPFKYEDQINYITIDNVKSAQQAVEHLIRIGKRRIATITGGITNVDALDRLNGYRQALQSAGLPIIDALITEGDFSRSAGYNGMKKLLRHQLDAVFAASDAIAIGALQAIQEAGLHVPEDIAVIGFDDLQLAHQSEPQLTTVNQPIEKKAEMATSMLLDLIEEKATPPIQIYLPTKLIIRESCGA
jgi:LacI family transcriptional regulator